MIWNSKEMVWASKRNLKVKVITIGMCHKTMEVGDLERKCTKRRGQRKRSQGDDALQHWEGYPDIEGKPNKYIGVTRAWRIVLRRKM